MTIRAHLYGARRLPAIVTLALVLSTSGAGEAPARNAAPDGAPPYAAMVHAAMVEDPLRDTASDPLTRQLVRTPPDSARAEEALDALEEGLSLWRDGDRLEGAAAVDLALARLPTSSDWRPLVRAELLASAGDTAGVRRALTELEPDSGLRARWGWSFLVDAYEEADDPPGALRAATAQAQLGIREGWPGESIAGAWLRAGRLALETADTVRAGRALRRAVGSADPGVPAVGHAARLLDRDFDSPDDAEHLAIGRALLEAGAWDRAQRRLLPLLERGGLDRATETELRVGVGRALVETARPAEAQRILGPALEEATPAELAAPVLYWRGRASLGRGRLEEARDTFLDLARLVPASPLAEEGLLMVLGQVQSRGGGTAETRVLEALMEVGIGSASGELAAVRFGTGKYLAGDFDGAATTFERYLEAGRRNLTRQQAAYWAALAHERRGEGERARELLHLAHRENPLSFYGTFAGDRLEAPVLPADLPPGPPPLTDEGLQDRISNAIIRLRIHQQVPTAGSFVWELARLERHFLARGTEAYDFAEALLARGFPLQAVVLGRTLHREEGQWNLRLLRIVYPFPHREHIVREARSRGLDPFFVAGLIRQESLFHPSIRSPAGAVGLMQLLPSTAREVARAEGIRYSLDLLDDPATNVRLGTAYLASMVQRFDGRAEDALSAYNAGPGRIRQWRGRPEYRDTHVFLEHIPFRETRNYVKVVQQNTRIYTALYGCGDFDPCLGLSYRAAVARSSVAGGAPSSSLAR